MILQRLALACLVTALPLSAVADEAATPATRKLVVRVQVVELNITRLQKKKFDFGELASGKQLAWLSGFSKVPEDSPEVDKFYPLDNERDVARVIDSMVEQGMAEKLSGITFEAPLGEESYVHSGETLFAPDPVQPETEIRKALGTSVHVTPRLIDATTARVEFGLSHMRIDRTVVVEGQPGFGGPALNGVYDLRLGQMYAKHGLHHTIETHTFHGWFRSATKVSEAKSYLFTLMLHPPIDVATRPR